MLEELPLNVRVILDADSMLYRAGWVKDKRTEDNPQGTDDFLTADQAKPVVNGFYRKIRQALRTRRIDSYIGEGETFRHKIARTRPYKGGRSAVKPPSWDALYEWMIERHDATVIRGVETDDIVAGQQYQAWHRLMYQEYTSAEDITVLCHIDKDLLQIPGYHYNWVKDDLFYVTELEGEKFFWWQMIVGDSVDKVPGCEGAGPVAAGALDSLEGTEEWRDLVESLYRKRYSDKWHRQMQEQADLLWMRRWTNDRRVI